MINARLAFPPCAFPFLKCAVCNLTFLHSRKLTEGRVKFERLLNLVEGDNMTVNRGLMQVPKVTRCGHGVVWLFQFVILLSS